MKKLFVVFVFAALVLSACNPLEIFQPEKKSYELEGCQTEIVVSEIGDLLYSTTYILQSSDDSTVLGQSSGDEYLDLSCCTESVYIDKSGVLSVNPESQ